MSKKLKISAEPKIFYDKNKTSKDLNQKSIEPIQDVIIYEFEKCLYYIPELEILKVCDFASFHIVQ